MGEALVIVLAAVVLSIPFWRGRLGSLFAAVSCQPVLHRVAERQARLDTVAACLAEREPAAVTRLAEAVEGPFHAPALTLALTDAPGERWADSAGIATSDRVRLAHEAAVRGVPCAAEPDADGAVERAEVAVAAAEQGEAPSPAYDLLAQPRDLPAVSLAVLSARLAAATDDAELAQRAREAAGRAMVADEPPATLLDAWRAAVAPWLRLDGPLPLGVAHWQQAPARPNDPTEARPFSAPFAQRLEVLRTLLRELSQAAIWPHGPRLSALLVSSHVVQARPDRGEPGAVAEQWRELLTVVDDDSGPGLVRAVALVAFGRLLRAARSGRLALPVDGLTGDDLARWRAAAAHLDDPPSRAAALLDATAVGGSLPGIGAAAWHNLADAVVSETAPAFWSALLADGGPWLASVSFAHPARAPLLEAYLRQRWLRQETVPRFDTHAEIRLAGTLHELAAHAQPPVSWALRGVPETEQYLLNQALVTLAQELHARGETRIRDRYREFATAALRAWSLSART